LDGHFGNHPALEMVRQCQLHLISKLRSDAALFFPYSGSGPKRGPRPRLGERLDYHKMPDQYLKTTLVEDGIETRIYQMQLLHREFSMPLNVVILIKTNLETKAWAHVILFSSDLELPYDKLIDFYSLRFQIEFNFRDAKQFWGLEDFMNVNQTAVTNAANLSLFLVNISQLLMYQYRKDDPNFSILDLKAYYRGYRYVIETIKILPQLSDENLVSQLFQKVAVLGRVHPAKSPVFSG
jgi:putative transposase